MGTSQSKQPIFEKIASRLEQTPADLSLKWKERNLKAAMDARQVEREKRLAKLREK